MNGRPAAAAGAAATTPASSATAAAGAPTAGSTAGGAVPNVMEALPPETAVIPAAPPASALEAILQEMHDAAPTLATLPVTAAAAAPGAIQELAGTEMPVAAAAGTGGAAAASGTAGAAAAAGGVAATTPRHRARQVCCRRLHADGRRPAALDQ